MVWRGKPFPPLPQSELFFANPFLSPLSYLAEVRIFEDAPFSNSLMSFPFPLILFVFLLSRGGIKECCSAKSKFLSPPQ